jgi:hypothetical protein
MIGTNPLVPVCFLPSFTLLIAARIADSLPIVFHTGLASTRTYLVSRSHRLTEQAAAAVNNAATCRWLSAVSGTEPIVISFRDETHNRDKPIGQRYWRRSGRERRQLSNKNRGLVLRINSSRRSAMTTPND